MASKKSSGGRADGGAPLTRRGFFKAGAAAGAGLAVSKMAFVRNVHAAGAINVALVGAGKQGLVLMMSVLKIKSPTVRFKAVCDIWTSSRGSSSP